MRSITTNNEGVRKTRWAIIRNTYQQLKDTSLKTFLQWLPTPYFGKWSVSNNSYLIKQDKLEIEILFRALDRAEQMKNLLSLELTGAWVNEAREIPWEIIQALQGRVGRYPNKNEGGASWFGIFMDTNPPDTDSWWYRLFEEQKPSNCAIFKQPSGLDKEAENIVNLPKNYYQNLLNSLSTEQQKIYIQANYGSIFSGKAIYPEYNDNIHCFEFTPNPEFVVYRGWDFGLTPACILSQLDALGHWYIFEEYVEDNMAIDSFSDKIIHHCKQNYAKFKFIDYGDPSGNARVQTDAKTCFEILQSKNIIINPSPQDNYIRIEAVKKALTTRLNDKPIFILHPNCKILRKGFLGGYRYKKIANYKDIYTEKPEKNSYSHIHDALQYIATVIFTPILKNYPTAYHKDVNNIKDAWLA